MHGCTEDKDAYLRRLRQVEGQVRGPDAQATIVEAAQSISRPVKS